MPCFWSSFFGVVECDLSVPDVREHFSEFCSIFKNTLVSREEIGETMREFAKKNNITNQLRRMLIGSLHAEKILLGTPLLKSYLEHGLETTKIYQTMEYSPVACFISFGKAVTKARRAGDRDKENCGIVADTMKLVGNSASGKSITKLENHCQIKYCTYSEACTEVNSTYFRDAKLIDGTVEENNQVYELSMAKKRLVHNLPVQIDFLCFNMPSCACWNFTLIAWIGFLTGVTLSMDPPEAKEFDKRLPGLFKLEWEGEGMICLNSKTYYCFGESGDKACCKGVSHAHNELNAAKYLRVLRNGEVETGVNKGFRVVDGAVPTDPQTWEQSGLALPL